MRRFRLRAVATAAVAVLVPALLVAAPDARAINQGPTGPETVPGTDTPMWQTNNAVWATAVSNGVLYVGGQFTSIRPPNVARGTGEVSMTRLAAFHAAGPNAGKPCVAATPCPGIGVWTNQNVGGTVFALSVTPDGRTLYVGGDFTQVRGVGRGRAAAFDLTAPATNRLLGWNPNVNGGVRSLATTDATVYLGGTFTTAAGQPRNQTAAYQRASGAITGWAPGITRNTAVATRVSALMLAPDGTGRVVLGGRFDKVNGADHYGVAQVDGVTGKVNGPMSDGIVPQRPGGVSEVKALATDGTRIFVGNEGDGPSVFDGTAAVDPASGNRLWLTDCHGATQAVAVIGDVLYVGSHAHDCTTPPIPGGGFAQSPFQSGAASWYHLMAERTTGDADTAGSLLAWFPRPDPGPAGPNILGPRALATDGSTLFVGGQSLTMNGRRQEGIAMFRPGGTGARPNTPVASARSANGQVTVRWTGVSDLDDNRFTYEVLKNGAVVHTVTDSEPWWRNPGYVWRDPGAPAGQYVVRVTDGSGLTSQRAVTPTAGGYEAAVEANNPSLHWRLDDPAGPTAADSTGGPTGTYRGGYDFGQRPGAIEPNAAVAQTNGGTTGIAANTAPAAAPANYSLEMWFRSESAGGGRLIGFSGGPTGATASPHRSLYMTNGGQLIYAIRNADNSTCKNTNTKYRAQGLCYLWSKQGYNDGGWHHVVVTQSSASGMVLYVDGARVGNDAAGRAARPATGMWRVGGDNLSGLPRSPAFATLPGEIDEVAVYPTALSAAQVAAHYAAAE